MTNKPTKNDETSESISSVTNKAGETTLKPMQFISQHSGRFHGRSIEYTAVAGETFLHDKNGEAKATIFSFAYLAKLSKNNSKKPSRPVTFLWNGGPGSASLWLHMGTFGPKRVSIPSDGSHPNPPPYPVIDVPETLLDITDLVFVDPVGTGFSKALGKHQDEEFWGLTEDAKSIAEFIREWVTLNGRWNSPKFIIGESFGTTRAAAVSKLLEKDFRLSLNGIILLAQALDYTGSCPYYPDNLIACITFIPTMAATALYHGRIQPPPKNRDEFLQEARNFATDELLPALFKGNKLDLKTRREIAEQLNHFTGINLSYIESVNLGINGFRFAKELRRDEGLAIGLLDTRYIRHEMDNLIAEIEGDASREAIGAAFKTALMSYMYDDLNIRWERLYQAPPDPDLDNKWRWRPVPEGQPWEPTPINTARDLSTALRVNPSLKVLVASGYYDLVTPFFDAEYTLGRHDIPADRVIYRYYDSGHMLYVNEDSRLQLLKDIREFMINSLALR